MISRFTWPNFKEGNDEEGTKVLLKKKNMKNDLNILLKIKIKKLSE